MRLEKEGGVCTCAYTTPFMKKFEKAVFSVAWLGRGIGKVALVGLTAIAIANIIGRLFHYPIPGAYAYVSLLGCILIAFSMAYCQVRKGHISIGFVMERLPQRGQAVIDSITSVIGVALFMVLAWRCVLLGTEAWEVGLQVGITGLPLYPFAYVIAFGSLLLALVLIVDAYKNLSQAVKR